MKSKPRMPAIARRRAPRARSQPVVSEQGRWVQHQELMAKAMRWGLCASIACGFLAFVMLVTGIGVGSTPAPRPRPVAADDMAEQAAAGELASQFVLTWLQAKRGEEKTLAPFVRIDHLRLPSEQAYIATDAQIAHIEKTSAKPTKSQASATATTAPSAARTDGVAPVPPTTYAVTVAVTVRGVNDQPGSSLRRYFAVPVVLIGTNGAKAAALPAEVPAPTVPAELSLGYRYKLPSNHPITSAASQFIGALVAGTGEITRYVSPGTTIRAVLPPPYESAAVIEMAADKELAGVTRPPADGATVRVLATAELHLDTTRSVTAQYALTLTGRGGRWEVSAMDDTPLLPTRPTEGTEPAPPAQSSPSATATTAPTTTSAPTLRSTPPTSARTPVPPPN